MLIDPDPLGGTRIGYEMRSASNALLHLWEVALASGMLLTTALTGLSTCRIYSLTHLRLSHAALHERS